MEKMPSTQNDQLKEALKRFQKDGITRHEERKTAVYKEVHEDLSTRVTKLARLMGAFSEFSYEGFPTNTHGGVVLLYSYLHLHSVVFWFFLSLDDWGYGKSFSGMG